MNESNNRQATNVVEHHAVAVSNSLSKPMFLSDQFEAYLKVVEMELDGRIQRLVDLRSLHEKLGVRDNYRDWAPRSLTNSRSVEGVHYISRVGSRNVGRPSKEHCVCFEKAKIIAARSNAENSLDICEWLDRLMIQDAVAQAVASVPVTESPVSPQPSTDVASTMRSVLSFAFDGHDIRVVRNESNEPWFVASDVCNALDIGNVTMALERLDADDLSSTEVMDSSNRFQKTRVVSQSGLFELVAGSRKPQAKPFRKWVFRTVLPSIAKTGTYSEAPTPAPQISRLEVARELVAALEREEAAREEAARLTHTIASNVLIPRPAYKENAEGIALQRIKREIAPYLSIKVIAHVLKHFGQKRTYVQYGDHENQVVRPFVREGVENAIAQFLDQAERRVSHSRKSVVLTHDCLLGDEAMVSAEDAIEYFGYSPDDFGIATS